MSETVRALLIDDHALCRRGLADLLEHRAGVQVVGMTGNPNEASRLIRELTPDIVMMDLRMPQSDGITMLLRLREEGITVPVVILTVSDSEEDLGNAIRAGVRGYLLKDMEPEDIVDSFLRAAQGEVVIAPAMTMKLAHMLQSYGQKNTKEDLLALLTSREREILDHLARGQSNKSIARALDISPDTVKLHVRHILAKLNLTSRVEAAVFAVEHKSVAPNRAVH
ncbi:MAG: response regulator [Betaproteobacteria bacterium]|nr:response regulator [Betaproteobacteria bacterium]